MDQNVKIGTRPLMDINSKRKTTRLALVISASNDYQNERIFSNCYFDYKLCSSLIFPVSHLPHLSPLAQYYEPKVIYNTIHVLRLANHKPPFHLFSSQ